MTAAIDLSFLSWNPRIMQHPPGYDNPWPEESAGDYVPGQRANMAINTICTDMHTGIKTKHDSMGKAGKHVGLATNSVKWFVRSGSLYLGRYKFEKDTQC